MSKQSHTPGPWVSRNNMVFGGKKCICSNVNAASPTLQNIAEDVAMSIANARLIAAAPDLLAELKKTVDNEQQAVFEDWLLRTRPSGCFELVQSQFHESSDFADFRESWKSQIAAIAKATGQ